MRTPVCTHDESMTCPACRMSPFAGGAGTKPETVNHPPHYGGDTTYEVIKVIEAWELDKSFCLGNAIKYIARAGKKGGTKEVMTDDLRKARWYLNREIERLEGMR